LLDAATLAAALAGYAVPVDQLTCATPSQLIAALEREAKAA
jgi:hypothetical protein